MANSITLAKKYVPLLDEVYKKAAITGVLESDASLARAGANANEIVIPKISMDGLADYSRNGGYVGGDVTMTWETVQFNYERGRMFGIDAMDNEETMNMAFGKLAGEFIRTKVAPELDAFRFATYAAAASSDGKKSAAITTGADAVAALRACSVAMDEAEVPAGQRVLFLTATLKGLIDDLDTTKSKEVLGKFTGGIHEVPQTRFYTAIDLKDGTSSGETAGGFAKATGALDINFLAVHKPAVLQFTKHAVPKIISPEANQKSDGWLYGYRNYGLADVYENKVAGIYLHTKPSA